MLQYLGFIGPFPIRTYGLFVSLAIILGTMTAYALCKKDGRGYEKYVVDIAIYSAIAGLIGGRLWDVFFFDWGYYSHHLLEIPFVWQGGMAIQGGIIFGVGAAYIYTKKHHIDMWTMADIVAPALILGQSIGRMANLMNGDAFGHPTGSSFGILYPKTTLAYATYGNQPLWPAEIWEGQIDVLIFVLLLYFGTQKHARGQVFTLYVVLYSIARFFLEFLRGDYTNLTLGLHSAQMTSLIVIIVGTVIFFALPYMECKKSPTKKGGKP